MAELFFSVRPVGQTPSRSDRVFRKLAIRGIIHFPHKSRLEQAGKEKAAL
jgi:hypothetical protein